MDIRVRYHPPAIVAPAEHCIAGLTSQNLSCKPLLCHFFAASSAQTRVKVVLYLQKFNFLSLNYLSPVKTCSPRRERKFVEAQCLDKFSGSFESGSARVFLYTAPRQSLETAKVSITSSILSQVRDLKIYKKTYISLPKNLWNICKFKIIPRLCAVQPSQASSILRFTSNIVTYFENSEPVHC
jgi:hypothetical protein